MNCQSCQSELQPTANDHHYYCHSCENHEFALPLQDCKDGIQPLDRPTDFRCPVCVDQNLEVGKVVGSQVCFCGHCRGFVVDSESFGVLVRQLRAEFLGNDDRPTMMNQQQLEHIRHCPACAQKMNTHPYYGPGNVVIDSCPHCKLTWLDHSELAKIKRAPGRR